MKVDDIRLKGFKSYTLVDDVKKTLQKLIKLMSLEKIKTVSALGRVISEDIFAPINVPHFSRSAMDGFAVKAKDTFGASQRSPIRLTIISKIKINEVSDKVIQDGQTIQIPTGGPIPDGADAVIKLEDVKLINGQIEIYSPITPFKNIAKVGEDIKKGNLIVSKGTIIRPQEITLLLACNILDIDVYQKPRVAIITTGSELVEIGTSPKVGQIIETNSYSIISLCEIYGGLPERLGIIEDNMESLIQILEKSLKYDIIVFTGGSSVGEDDLIPYVINNFPEGKILVHGIAMRPGSPTAIGLIQNKLIFCLPGFPVATMISFETFVGYTIRKMMNAKILDPRPIVKAILTRQIPSQLGRRDYVRVKLDFDDEKMEYYAEPIRSGGSGIISSLVKATGIIEIPEDLEGYEKGSKVFVKLYLPR
ncbi:MAG: molybdopterin molybdotransferase MoeA [Candidatus Helarchaeota archaeon]